MTAAGEKLKANDGWAHGRAQLVLIMAVLPLAAICFQMARLGNEPCPRGTDAYYYALQADSWHRTGQVRIPDSSPLHPLIGSLMRAGLGAEDALKVWTGLSLLLFCTAFYALGLSRAVRPLWLGPLILWPLWSPSVLFCALEFPKTFSFTIVFTLALAAARPRPGWLLAMSGLFAAACLLHKIALVHTASALAGLLVFWGLGLARPRPVLSRALAVKLALTALVGLGLLTLLIFKTSLGTELSRLGGRRLTPGVLALLLEPNLPSAVRVELLLAGLALIGILLKNRYGLRGVVLALGLTGPAFMPAFGAEPFSLGERFGLLLPLTTALALIFLQPPLTAAPSSLLGDPNPAHRKKSRAALTALAALALAGSLVRPDWSYPPRLSLPCFEYESLTKKLERLDIPMLIVNRDFHFYYKFRTGREAFSYEPEKHWPKDRIWRLVYGVSPAELRAYLPTGCGWGDSRVVLFPSTPYSLVREDCYVPFRAAALASTNPELRALVGSSVMNPSEPRPAFLYQKHQADEKDEFSALP